MHIIIRDDQLDMEFKKVCIDERTLMGFLNAFMKAKIGRENYFMHPCLENFDEYFECVTSGGIAQAFLEAVYNGNLERRRDKVPYVAFSYGEEGLKFYTFVELADFLEQHKVEIAIYMAYKPLVFDDVIDLKPYTFWDKEDHHES